MTRDEVIEKCARVCDARAESALSGNHDITYAMAVRCAQAIRALKGKNVAPQPSTAMRKSAPSKEGVGQGDAASAAQKERRHTIDTAVGVDDRRGAAPDQPKAAGGPDSTHVAIAMAGMCSAPGALTREAVLGALARGYCAPLNSSKVMDPTLLHAQADEILALRSLDDREDAERWRFYCDNVDALNVGNEPLITRCTEIAFNYQIGLPRLKTLNTSNELLDAAIDAARKEKA